MKWSDRFCRIRTRLEKGDSPRLALLILFDLDQPLGVHCASADVKILWVALEQSLEDWASAFRELRDREPRAFF